MSNDKEDVKTIIEAPRPSRATVESLPNQVLSVVLAANEEVEWVWSTTVSGVCYVSGYTIRETAAA